MRLTKGCHRLSLTDPTRSPPLGRHRRCHPSLPVLKNTQSLKSLNCLHCLQPGTKKTSPHRLSNEISRKGSTYWINRRRCPSPTTKRRKKMARHQRGLPPEEFSPRVAATHLIDRLRPLQRCQFSKPQLPPEEQLRHHSHGRSGVRFPSTTRFSLD